MSLDRRALMGLALGGGAAAWLERAGRRAELRRILSEEELRALAGLEAEVATEVTIAGGRAKIGARIRAELEAGRLVEHDGWPLTPTELALAAGSAEALAGEEGELEGL